MRSDQSLPVRLVQVIQHVHDALTLTLRQQFKRTGSAKPDRAAYEPRSGLVDLLSARRGHNLARISLLVSRAEGVRRDAE
jgi:hypothetical protein